MVSRVRADGESNRLFLRAGSPLRVTPKVDLPKTSTTVPQETVANSGHAQAPLPNVVNKLTKPSLSVVAAAAGNGGKANHLLQPHRPRVGGVGAVARHLAMSAVLGGRGIGHAVERAEERETTDNQRSEWCLRRGDPRSCEACHGC